MVPSLTSAGKASYLMVFHLPKNLISNVEHISQVPCSNTILESLVQATLLIHHTLL